MKKSTQNKIPKPVIWKSQHHKNGVTTVLYWANAACNKVHNYQ